MNEHHQAERLLRSILEGTAAHFGEEFLRALVKNLAQALEVRYAFISEFAPAGADEARVLAFWKDGDFAPPFAYRLSGTPCAELAARAEFLVPDAIRLRFPGDPRLEALAAECFFGMRLRGAAGAALGVLAIADVKPLERERIARIVMGIFAARAGVELDRMRAAAELAESEARFRAMAELSSDYYWEQDEELRFTLRIGMPSEARVYPLAQVLGQRRWELPALNMTEADWARHRAELEARREFRGLEIERPMPAGERRWVSSSGRPMFDAAGRFRGYRGIGQDITARKRAEQALQASERRYRALVELSSDWYWQTDEQHRFTFRQGKVLERMGLKPESDYGKARWELDFPNMTPADWEAHRGVLERREEFRDLLLARRNPAGEIHWASMSGQPLYGEDGQFLGYHGTGRDVTHQVLAEQALREGAERLRLIADNVPEMIAYTDAGFRFQYANRRFVEFYFGPGRRIEGSRMAELMDEATFASVRTGVVRALGGETLTYEVERVRADGATRRIEATLVPHQDGAGRALGVYTFIRDVTEARRAEQERREADLQRRLLTDSVPAMIAYVGGDYRLRYANRAFAEFYGEGEGGEGRPLAEVLGERTWGATRASVERAMAGQTVSYTRTHQRRSGKLRQVDASLVPHRDEAGQVRGIYILSLDVTQRHRRDEALRLRTRALDASVNSIMITEPSAGGQRIVYVNPAFERLSGYAAAEVMGRSPRLLYGNELEQPGVAALRAALREQRDTTARVRNYRKDGTPFWVEARVAPVRDEDGRVTHFISAGSDINDQVRYEQEIERHANFDPLTGLPNRNLLNDRLAQAIAKSDRSRLAAAVLYVDLDQFKRINDSLGHDMGDRVIAAIGARLSEAVRAGDTVARVGGDEFVMVLADLKREDDAAAVAQKVVNTVSTPLRVGSHEFVLSTSVGIALYPKDAGDAATLLRHADTALYGAKEQGRDRARFFDAEMNQRVVRFLAIEQDLRKGIEAGEFWLQYQPIVRLATGERVGAEALVRWRRPDGSVLQPAQFIPVAEESGLIVPLGRWILESAMRQAASWNRGGGQPCFVSVNLSARQFRDTKLLDTVQGALRESRVDPALIKLEITESAVMEDVERTEQCLGALKLLGVSLSVDDFGTGYSSLAYLKRFPIDTLKIDRSFVRGLPGDRDDLAISRAVIDLAGGLGMDAVAEGIETREQAAVLAANGCGFAQGYYFGRPIDPDQFA